MISHSPLRPASALRARMIEDMSVRGFSEKTPEDASGAAAPLRHGLGMPMLCRPSRRNRAIEKSSGNALPTAIVDPPPTPAHSESLARAAPPSNRHRRPPPAPPTAGSFFGGFRTPVPLYRVERSRRAGIRNP